MFCKKCGGKLESYASNCAFCGTPVEKYDTDASYVKQVSTDSPKSMTVGKWFGLPLINAIPVIGQIIYLVLLFKWAFGNCQDLTLKNWAKAQLIFFLIGLILAIISVIIFISNPDFMDEYENLIDGLR